MNIFDVILENTYTLPDLKHRVRILKDYLEGIFFKDMVPQFVLEDQKFIQQLPIDFFQTVNPKNFEQFFEDLENQIKVISPLILYLPFEIGKEDVQKISLWLRQNLKYPPPLLEVKIDPNLLGGSALSYKGVYKDYSLKARIESQKEEILQSLKSYI